MDQLKQNQVALREDMTHMKTHIGHLMEVLQTLARGQGEACQANLRAVVANPVLTTPMNPLGGNVPIMTQPPREDGPVNQNNAYTFSTLVQWGAQTEIDDHQDTFYIPKADSIYDAYGPSPTEVEKKLLS